MGETTSLGRAVHEALETVFGFGTLRPLQREAIDAALAGRDALVVLPTGGGKSLCYQLPPLVTGKLTVVVSPLIALMQDQVEGLKLQGYPVAAVHSNQTAADRAELRRLVALRRLRLLLVAPERLFAEGFTEWLRVLDVGAFAIDEAHCISQWGHDFRPEYRRLAELRPLFPDVPFHAYTATATPRVRQDIVEQLRLREPTVLVGIFDRPNLTYRVLPRQDVERQVGEAIRRHPDAASIVYCLARKDTEALAAALCVQGLQAAAYHAGLPATVRTRVGADFRAERLNVVVATVAFGMGIDRGDVSLVVHAALPKSVEHYQQETGRAGRDGLPAECLLLYSAADAVKWRGLLERSALEAGVEPQVIEAQLALITHMQRLAQSTSCRHRALSEYFGQSLDGDDCGACDVCLHELEPIADAHATVQKILSAVARTGQRFGTGYLLEVLRGSRSERVLARGHDQLPTYGLLREVPAPRLANYIDQLVDQGLLERAGGEYPVLALTAAATAVLQGSQEATLLAPKAVLADPPSRTRRGRERDRDAPLQLAAEARSLFDELRVLRRALAGELGLAPFMVVNDATLVELATVRPSTRQGLVNIRGIGARKLEAFGDTFLAAIHDWCARTGQPLDAGRGSRPRRLASPVAGSAPAERDEVGGAREAAACLFRQGCSVADVAARLDRAVSTVGAYLVDFVTHERPATLTPWLSPDLQAEIEGALACNTSGRLKPVYDGLGGRASYDDLRVVQAFHGPRRGR
jgi:ATP-dependent DNA helicase RecQ